MLLLVGLGNPGPRYAHNRHNIGYMAVDAIVRRHSFSPWKQKFQGVVAEGEIAGHKCLALKPGTFMNLSGQSAGDAARFYKIPVEDMVVFQDELDLPPGKVRVKRGGGHGGHNGLKSLDAHLGPNYRRVRLGIGHPGARELVTPWVLSDFTGDEKKWLEPLLAAVADQAGLLVTGEDEKFMTRIAQA